MFFWLTACVLFQSGAIDCAKDQACVPETGVEETGGGDDTQVQDTNPPVLDPVMGAWITGEDGGSFVVHYLSPAGSLEQLASGSQLMVAAAQDDTHLIGVTEPGELIDLLSGQLMATLPQPLTDIAVVGGEVIVATRYSLYRNKGGTFSQISTGSFTDLQHIVNDGSGGLYGVERVDGKMRLLRGTSSGWGVQVSAYDDRVDRSIDLFLGQGDKPMTCAEDGGVYLIEELAVGNTAPWRVPGSTVEDVRACSFDQGSQNVLLLTENKGLVRVDPTGQVTMVDLAIRGDSAFFGE
jgi:hypothetical protein